MPLTCSESSVPLEKLDGHLKALLRLKIREFVHLSPWFKDIPEADSTTLQGLARPSQPQPQLKLVIRQQEPACPNQDRVVGRRHARPALHLRARLY